MGVFRTHCVGACETTGLQLTPSDCQPLALLGPQAGCNPALHPSTVPHLDAGPLQLLVHRQSRALQAAHHGLALAARLSAAHTRARKLDLRAEKVPKAACSRACESTQHAMHQYGDGQRNPGSG